MVQRYDTYKDSGVQWLGEIPGHWGGTTMGRILSSPLQYGASESGDPTEHPGNWRYIRITDITLDGKLKNEGQKYLPKDIAELYPLEKGDLLFARSGATVGKSYLFNESRNACFAGYLIKARINKDIALPEYVSHFTKSAQYDEWKNRIFIQATIQNIGADKYSRLYVPLPPLPEQRSIVSYLDDKCGKIDEWIEKKQKEVELLQEMKQRVIADAVTRGLNPDVKMKATNIAWLPEVPEHWETKRSKYLLKLLTESSKRTRKIGLENIESNSGKYIPSDTIFDGDGVDFNEGDILYGKLRPYLNKVWLAEFEGNAVGDFYVYRTMNNYHNAFAKYLLMSSGFVGISNASTYGAKMPRVSSQFIHSLHFPVPPLSEQRAIVSYINERTAKIDKMVENVNREIENLKEYKQRLISDVVTGQIKVC